MLSEIKTLVVNKTRNDITDIGYRVIKSNSLDQKFVSVRNKRENQELLLKPFLTSTELQNYEIYWIKRNQESIDNRHIELLQKQLNVTRDENDLLICTGRLENSPLPYESKSPYLINRHHKLAELIGTDIHIKRKHISIKQTLTEAGRRFWICSELGFIRNILSKCALCRRFEGPCYSYPTTPPSSKHRLEKIIMHFMFLVLIILVICMQRTLLIRVVMNCIRCG